MMGWSTFIQETTNYVEQKQAQSIDDFVGFIVDQYDMVIKSSATDMVLGNPVLTTNPQGMKQVLISGFTSAANDFSGKTAPLSISNALRSSLTLYWTGAQLGMLIPPPGTVSVISNTVTSPGVVPPIPIENTSDPKKLVISLFSTFAVHLLSIQTLTVGLAPPPTSVPVPFPSVGIRVI